jgi:carboxyl-terminal processing protease
MRRGVKIALITIAGVVAAILLVSGGFLLGLDPSVRSALHDLLPGVYADSIDDYGLQQEVLGKLESTYYKAIDDATLKGDAIDGMVAGLDDPYTVYMDPKEYASFQEATSGSYKGVGMTVEMKDRLVTIVSTFKGSPAQLAGIRAGDVILSVDGVSTEGLNLDEVVGKIKGAEGTTVALQLYRPPVSTTTTVAGTSGGGNGTSTTTSSTGDSTDDSTAAPTTADVSQLPPGGETKEYTLTRKAIEVPATERETLDAQGKKVALIRFFAFSDGSATALRAEVKKSVESDKVAAIILDLRSNGGGFLDEGIDVAGIFISSGVIVSTKGLHFPERVYSASGDAYARVPLYVLTDPYTASASEIVSGALQDYKRATLVGQTTFGKGLVQSIEPLSNGGAVKVTTQVYLTPKGRDINKTGIAPDVVAPDDPNTATVDECVQAALGLISGAAAKD